MGIFPARPQRRRARAAGDGGDGTPLAMGGFGLMNILLMAVTERTLELGIRMAVGARRVDLLVQFLVEGLALALVGGALGIVIGFGGALVLAPWFVAGVAELSALLGLGTVVVAVGSSVAIGLIAGAYPAYRASRLNPVEALRSE